MTPSDNIEKAFRWLLNIIEDFRQALVLSGIYAGFDELRIEQDEENRDTSNEFLGVPEIGIEWYNGIIEWIRNRFWGLFDSFSNHRFLFAKWIQWNYAPPGQVADEETRFDNRWELHQRDHFMDPFCDAFEATFGKNIREMNVEKIESYYPHITAHLDGNGPSTHRQFQAIYSFCRSMWVVLLVLSLFYALAIYQPFGDLGIIASDPRILLLPPGVKPIVPVATFAGSMIFLDAAGTYKRHFIEYLMAAFSKQYGDSEGGEQTDLFKF